MVRSNDSYVVSTAYLFFFGGRRWRAADLPILHLRLTWIPVNFILASYYSRLFLVWHHWTPVIFESKLNSVSSCCFSFVLTTPGLVDAPFVNSVEYVIQHLYLRISDPTTQFDGKALPSIPFHTMVAVGW